MVWPEEPRKLGLLLQSDHIPPHTRPQKLHNFPLPCVPSFQNLSYFYTLQLLQMLDGPNPRRPHRTTRNDTIQYQSTLIRITTTTAATTTTTNWRGLVPPSLAVVVLEYIRFLPAFRSWGGLFFPVSCCCGFLESCSLAN